MITTTFNMWNYINTWKSSPFMRCTSTVVLAWLLFCVHCTMASDSTSVRQIYKDPKPFTLPPSAFSASSVLQNKAEFQAHKANFVVFASQEDTAEAWCPNKPIQNQLTEWLQIEFEALKSIRYLFTEGLRNNQNSFVPAFLLRYQRQDGQRWYDYRMRNGTELVYANHNSQTIAISLDPPIVAKRFRLYPYNKLELKFMCLKLAVYGSAFNDGVIEYTIPEGGIYRMDPRLHVALNDTSYDGRWTYPPPPPPSQSAAAALSLQENSGESSTALAVDRRAYFHGGLGLLTDKRYYEGHLPELGDSHNVVGWFRREHATQSDHISMMFTFDRVRNFTGLQIHALNSLNYVAVFRRLAVQFSVGGQFFDRHMDPIVVEIPRDTENRQARWIPIDLSHRVGRFVRIILWFDYDWIVLSEVTFESRPVAGDVIPTLVEKSTDPIHKLPGLELSSSERIAPVEDVDSTAPEEQVERDPRTKTSGPGLTQRDTDEASLIAEKDAELVTMSPAASVNPTIVMRSTTRLSFLTAILCGALGLLLFIGVAFVIYCVQRNRQKRSKKPPKPSATSSSDLLKRQHNNSNNNYHQNNRQFLLTNPLQTGNTFLPSHGTVCTDTLSPASFQYNPLTTAHTGPIHHDAFATFAHSMNAGMPGSLMTSPHDPTAHTLSMAASHGRGEHMMAPPSYSQFGSGLDQDNLLALQLIQHGAVPGSNFSSLGAMTLQRRGGCPDPTTFPGYPFVSMAPNGLLGLTLSTSSAAATAAGGQLPTTTVNNNPSAKLSFCPPPPPDQPLPPLPPPSTSPDCTHKPQLLFGDPNTMGGAHRLIGPSYTSAFPHPHSYLTQDTGLGPITMGDGSMPEYASASLFSGAGSVQPSPGAVQNGSTNSKSSTNETDLSSRMKSSGTGETYCIPHQNSVHRPLGGNVWLPPPNGLRMATTRPCPLTAGGGPGSDCPTGSLDSSGMYYLANTGGDHNLPMDSNSLLPMPNGNFPPSSALFLPNAHLIPIHGMTLFPGHPPTSELAHGNPAFQTELSDCTRRVENGNTSSLCSAYLNQQQQQQQQYPLDNDGMPESGVANGFHDPSQPMRQIPTDQTIA